MFKKQLLLVILIIGEIFTEDSDEFHVHVRHRPKSAYHHKSHGDKNREYQNPPLGLRTFDEILSDLLNQSDNFKYPSLIVRKPLSDGDIYVAAPSDVNLDFYNINKLLGLWSSTGSGNKR